MTQRPRRDAEPGGITGTVPREDEAGVAEGPWRAVVHNDPVNLMSYVVYVFRRHFGYSRPHAERLMRQVHEEGRAIVARGSREKIETDVQAMHAYGLQATLEKDGED